MSYSQFQRMMASYGFLDSVLSEQEYKQAYVAFNGDIDEIYSYACDLHNERSSD